MCSSDVIHAASAGSPEGEAIPLAEPVTRPLRRVQDLTHTLTPDFPIFPFYKPFRAETLATVEAQGFAARELRFAEHVGTHLDAPAHFFADGATAEHLPPASLVAPLAVVSIAERAARDEDTTLSVDDVLAWERLHGRIPAGAVVALHSGWEARLGEPGRFLNSDALGVLHSPGFSAEAAEFLVRERRIAGAATDTLSLDFGPSVGYEAHRVILGAGRYGLENVANLARVPPSGATIFVGAPKHLGATGGPARLLALF
jgi:kynurenine formamidase